MEFTISWTTTTTPKSDYPYMTATCDLVVNELRFDVLDWNPEDGPESVGFWEYFADYYGMGLGSIVPDDSIFAVSLACLFETPDGAKRWIPIGDDNTIRYYGYDSAGTYSDSFVLYTRGVTGTFTFSLTILVQGTGDYWNTTIAWDKVVISVINPYEQ
jgi:hypothetical protein